MRAIILGALLLLAACAQTDVGCPEDAMICPDGTTVVRSGPNCEFEPCPSGDGTPVAPAGDLAPGGQYTFCENEMQRQTAQEQGWTCVTECPDGYDEYASQIGKRCVEHYGTDKIGTWPICQTALDCPEGTMCTAAHVTTESENVPEPEYRCAPQDYTDFLLHTAGLTTVDENGETSVVIA